MGRRFVKKAIRKIKRALDPKEADTIYRKETIDSHGNRHILEINFRPQLPTTPDLIMKSKVKYTPKDE